MQVAQEFSPGLSSRVGESSNFPKFAKFLSSLWPLPLLFLSVP